MNGWFSDRNPYYVSNSMHEDSDEYSIINWNVNGWFTERNPYYLEFKLNVLTYLNASFIILTETHCMDNQVISIDNYTVFQQNRKLANINSRRGSGGVIVAINNSILDNHKVLSVYKNDGLLGIKIENNETKITVGVVGNYLSPDNYHYGQDPEGFFNNLLSMWQDLSDCDIRIGGGDLNARTKELQDFIPEIDGNLPARTNPDNVKNSHGSSFITFLKDSRSIILNGRVTPHLNNFTFVSTRGSSVPDYIYCPIENLEFCTEMKVILMTDIINLTRLVPPRILPDHSILMAKFKPTFFNQNIAQNLHTTNKGCETAKNARKKNLKKMPDTFFLSPEVHSQVIDTIAKLENSQKNQNEIDQLWQEIRNIFMQELDKLPDIPTSLHKKPNKQFKRCKKFWNDELANCWKALCSTEKLYLNFKANNQQDLVQKRAYFKDFKEAQKKFDAKFRYFKRKYKKQQFLDLENDSVKAPQKMWEKLKSLGDPPSSKVVLEIIREDESISTDIKEILTRWQNDISKLFSGLRENPDFSFNDDFYNQILEKKEELENLLPNDFCQTSQYDCNQLNSDLLFAEVSKCIEKSRLKKAYLEIPNEALKNENAKLLLFNFFNLCFKSGLNPSEWDKNNIKPIPKKDKDQRDPLQNRCITIMCCVAKIYSSILTQRLQKFLESNNILVDEQNGFRATRSCIDHIFVICTVLRNRKSLGQDTFLAFIDYKKAFDSVDRSLLMYKLLKIGIHGNFYNAISAMFQNPRSRVLLNEYSTDYFDCPIGVKQGDCISATLFAIYINDLAIEIKDCKIGIDLTKTIDGESVHSIPRSLLFLNILLYADDIVCMGETEMDMQELLLIVENWCRKWRLEVNLTKTNVMHIRAKRKPQSKFTFLFNFRPVDYCKSYKYLGTCFNEFLDFDYTASALADAAGRALSSIFSKCIKNGGLPYVTYTAVIESCVNSISQYSSEVWGYKEYESTKKIFLRAARFYLGLPKNAPIPAIIADIDWLEPVYNTQLKMIRQYHRMLKMEDTRLTKAIMLWDAKFSEKHGIFNTWTKEIRCIFNEYDLGYFAENMGLFQLKDTIGTLKSKMKIKQNADIKLKCSNKPQLRTYVKIKEFGQKPCFLQKPLSFIQRKFLSKFCTSCLEIKICSGRYLQLPEASRVCLVTPECQNQSVVESDPLPTTVCWLQ